MDKQTLHELLERLHNELREAPSLTDADRALVLEVQSDIRRMMETPPGQTTELTDTEQWQQPRNRLQEAVLRFAGTHPKLSSELGEMFTALSNAGL